MSHLFTHRPKPAHFALVFLAWFATYLAAQTSAAGPPNQAPPAARRGGGAGGDYKEYDPALIDQGKKTFSQNCAFCHGTNAKGGESGPDLLRSITVLHDENGESIGQMILNGRPDKGMPKFAFSSDQIAAIAAFLHDGVRAAAQRGTYKILDILVGNAKAGEAYFNSTGKCSTCHSVSGDLAHIGSKYDPVNLQQKFVMPREGRSFGRPTELNKATAITATVALPSGETVNGRVERIDDFSITLIDSTGDYRSFTRDGDTPKVELHDPVAPHIALLRQYTDADIHNLTAYLVTVK
jgi:mono/diheme cytochrome c family protein